MRKNTTIIFFFCLLMFFASCAKKTVALPQMDSGGLRGYGELTIKAKNLTKVYSFASSVKSDVLLLEIFDDISGSSAQIRVDNGGVRSIYGFEERKVKKFFKYFFKDVNNLHSLICLLNGGSLHQEKKTQVEINLSAIKKVDGKNIPTIVEIKNLQKGSLIKLRYDWVGK